jgi:hypothetical protein
MLTELRTKSKISGQEINLKVSSHMVKEKLGKKFKRRREIPSAGRIFAGVVQ